MALITEIIKRYEVQARERIAEARQTNASVPMSAQSPQRFADLQSQERFAGSPAAAYAGMTATVWSEKPVDIGSQPGIDLSTKDPTEQDFTYFDWQNKLVEFYKLVGNANRILAEMQNNSKMLSELERVRSENAQLKEKLRQFEPQP